MTRQLGRRKGSAITACVALLTVTLAQVATMTAAQAAAVRAALVPGSINNILVISLENESFSSTFGTGSPATYLNGTLVPQGELLDNYYATGHVSLDNYIAEVSGQAPTPQTATDCFGSYTNVSPGTDDANTSTGQVDGAGCVYPAPTVTTHGAPTIADQLDAALSAELDHARGFVARIRRGHGERRDPGQRGNGFAGWYRLRAPGHQRNRQYGVR